MNDHKPLERLAYTKSNQLVSAKFKSSLLENQLVAIALTRIEANARDEKPTLKARLYPGELKRLIGDPTHVYTRLKRVSKNMTGHSIVLEDGMGNFKAFAVVTNADYIDGILEITLNDELRPHILGLEKRFTTLDLSVMTSFRRDSSFRLYEIFKSHIYKSNSRINEGMVEIEYSIAELRFTIGLCNADDESIRALRIRMGADIDWDYLYEKLDERAKIYKRWSEFERNVLKPAQDELKELADIRFEYRPLREGRSMSRIRFYLYPNKPLTNVVDEKQAFLNERKRIGRQNELPRDLPQFEHVYTRFVGHNDLTAEDIDMLLKKASLDDSAVISAIELADKQAEINNYVGWLVRCIESGGYKQTGTLSGDNKAYETAKEVKEEYDSANKDNVAVEVWARMKTFDAFKEFADYMYVNGVPIEALELTYTPKELVKMYTDYNTGKKVEF